MTPDRTTAEQMLAQLPTSDGKRFLQAAQLRHLELFFYAPRVEDLQTPHERDEFYIIQSGHGTFVRGDEHGPCKAGDLLFVEKGVEHRFLDFTEDFATWVIFLD